MLMNIEEYQYTIGQEEIPSPLSPPQMGYIPPSHSSNPKLFGISIWIWILILLFLIFLVLLIK
jgi:hypothetical protein